MTTFDEREQAFEAKFAQDETLRFQARARCTKQLGLWAADIMGLTGAAAQDYADSLVAADLKHPGNRDILGKIAADMATRHKTAITAQMIKDKMGQLFLQACDDLFAPS